MQGGGAAAGKRGEPYAELGIARGCGRKTRQQGAQIKPSATGDDRKYTSGFEIAERGAGKRGVCASGEFPARLHNVQ